MELYVNRHTTALLTTVLLLAGCPYVAGPKYDEIRDQDGDGSWSTRFGGPDCLDDNPDVTDCDADGDNALTSLAGGDDCDDNDASTHPGAAERCDGIDNDCDGNVDNDDPDVTSDTVFYVDADGDGVGDENHPRACQEFAEPDNPASRIYVAEAGDCDDENASISPDADELCDSIDNNCDGVIDDVGLWFIDDDDDGYGVSGTQATGDCTLEAGSGLAAVDGDCDDTDPARNPGAAEVPYDGVDGNCNGDRDDWDPDFDGHVDDAYWIQAQEINEGLPPDEQWDIQPGDCDESNPARFVGNTEVCDGVDNDCDERVDAEDLESAAETEELTLRTQVLERFVDEDGDGYAGTAVFVCPADIDSTVHFSVSTDCFDGGEPPQGFETATATAIHADAPEFCDEIDNNCDGEVDHSDEPFTGASTFFFDNDGDGVGSDPVWACGPDTERQIVASGDDCNDSEPTIFPGALEVCGDSIRQDCGTASPLDCDADGFEGSYVGQGTGEDCDDNRAEIHPDVPFEICDGVDNDCDGAVDSADDNLDPNADLPFWYVDTDADGYGVSDGTEIQQCDAPLGRAPNALDCDNSDPDLNPDTLWFEDRDGDGYGNTASATASCTAPGPEWVRVDGDCNDGDPVFNPDTAWRIDGDGDFAGDPTTTALFCAPSDGNPWVLASNGADCDDTDPGVTGGQLFYADADGDGSGDVATEVQACIQPPGTVTNAGDCNDGDASIGAFAVELCDGVDNDCDGDIDDDDATVVAPSNGPVGYRDEDGDGFGTPLAKTFCLTVQPGWASVDGDCDDTESAVFPGQVEICGNGVDDDCDGADSAPNWFADNDGDGFGDGPIVATDCTPPGPLASYATTDGDCDDTDDAINPSATEIDACDAIDQDCDGTPEPRLTWYRDRDGDGFGDDPSAIVECTPPTVPDGETGSWVLQGGDCDDADVDITFGRIWYVDNDGDELGDDATTQFACPQYDAAGEELTVWLYDDVDGDGLFTPGDGQLVVFAGDCDDDRPDLGLPEQFYEDDDADGWGGNSLIACREPLGGPPAGTTTRPGDCNDGDDTINPDAPDPEGDTVDSDCDGADGENDGGFQWYVDNDGDGFGFGPPEAIYQPGYVLNDNDCNDANPSITNGILVYDDLDEDTFGAGAPRFEIGVCAASVGTAINGDDCDDGDFDNKPGAIEVCDGVDNNCVNGVDEGVSTTFYADFDGDGQGNPNNPIESCGAPPAGFVADARDCNDTNLNVYTSAPELCDGLDNDCDAGTAFDTESTWHFDGDNDGHGGEITTTSCVSPGPAWTPPPTQIDCDDSNPTIHPGAFEDCDGYDNDCDGFTGVDEDDVDGDGVLVCAGDCDDSNPFVRPDFPELCDGIPDNDCVSGPDPEIDDLDADGLVGCDDPDDNDPNLPGQENWFDDVDGDGFGDPSTLIFTAAPPLGWVRNGDDCNDTIASINPNAPVELCDGLDNNCDGANVDGDPDVSNPFSTVLLPDAAHIAFLDTDGNGLPSWNFAVQSCNAVTGSTFTADGSPAYPLTPWDGNLFGFADCDDAGTTGTFYAEDRDEDGHPGANDPRDIVFDCTGTPLGPPLIAMSPTNVDCDPENNNRRDMVFLGDLVDADGDGFSFPANVGPDGECVARRGEATAPLDCDDTQFTNDPGTAFNTVEVDDSVIDPAVGSHLDYLIDACVNAELRVSPDDGLITNPTVPVAGRRLTFVGDTGAPCEPTDTSGCVSVDLDPPQGTYGFRNIGLLGTLHAGENVEINVEHTTVVDVAGQPILRAYGEAARIQAVHTEFFGSSAVVPTAVIDHVGARITLNDGGLDNPNGTAIRVNAGTLDLQNPFLYGAPAVLALGGQTRGSATMDSDATALVVQSNVEMNDASFSTTGSPLIDVGNTSFFQCTDCTINAADVGILSVGNTELEDISGSAATPFDVALSGSVTIDGGDLFFIGGGAIKNQGWFHANDVRLQGEANEYFDNSGVLFVDGLEVDQPPSAGPVLKNTHEATLVDVTGQISTMLEATGASPYVEIRDVDVSQSSSVVRPTFEVEGGLAYIDNVRIFGSGGQHTHFKAVAPAYVEASHLEIDMQRAAVEVIGATVTITDAEFTGERLFPAVSVIPNMGNPGYLRMDRTRIVDNGSPPAGAFVNVVGGSVMLSDQSLFWSNGPASPMLDASDSTVRFDRTTWRTTGTNSALKFNNAGGWMRRQLVDTNTYVSPIAECLGGSTMTIEQSWLNGLVPGPCGPIANADPGDTGPPAHDPFTLLPGNTQILGLFGETTL